jgi:hypothetical protein
LVRLTLAHGLSTNENGSNEPRPAGDGDALLGKQRGQANDGEHVAQGGTGQIERVDRRDSRAEPLDCPGDDRPGKRNGGNRANHLPDTASRAGQVPPDGSNEPARRDSTASTASAASVDPP